MAYIGQSFLRRASAIIHVMNSKMSSKAFDDTQKLKKIIAEKFAMSVGMTILDEVYIIKFIKVSISFAAGF